MITWWGSSFFSSGEKMVGFFLKIKCIGGVFTHIDLMQICPFFYFEPTNKKVRPNTMATKNRTLLCWYRMISWKFGTPHRVNNLNIGGPFTGYTIISKHHNGKTTAKSKVESFSKEKVTRFITLVNHSTCSSNNNKNPEGYKWKKDKAKDKKKRVN